MTLPSSPRLVVSTLSALTLFVVLSLTYVYWHKLDTLAVFLASIAATGCVAVIAGALKHGAQSALLVAAVVIVSILLY